MFCLCTTGRASLDATSATSHDAETHPDLTAKLIKQHDNLDDNLLSTGVPIASVVVGKAESEDT